MGRLISRLNRTMKKYLFILLSTHLIGCAAAPNGSLPSPVALSVTAPTYAPTDAQTEAAAKVGLDRAALAALTNKPLYRMKPTEVGQYIAYLQIAMPNLRARIAHLARKNIGQPYEIFLLGEFPYETIDDQPLFNLEKSDCVVFVEHTYAMALSSSWPEFFWVLQRMRYRDGVIGITTRNHYTETDWNRENRWLVSDISRELGKERATTYEMTVDRTNFFKTRYKIDRAVDIETTTEAYIPKADIASITAELQEGDYVNVVSTNNGKYWVSHVGIVVIGANGARHILHSIEPQVREETFDSFISNAAAREARQANAGKPGKVLAGFKFLRLNDAPSPPPMAPQPRPGLKK
jgi:hypothetical protein